MIESRVERETRRAYLILFSLLIAVQGGLFLYSLFQNNTRWMDLAGLGLSAVGASLVFRWGWPPGKVIAPAAYIGIAWTTGLLLKVLMGQAPLTPSLLLMSSLTVLLALNGLTLRHSLTAILLLSALLTAAVLIKAPELLGMLMWTLPLTGLLLFFNEYGHRIHAERLRSEQLYRLAFHDTLTGALNRRGGWEKLEALMVLEQEAGGILLIDIDNFKRINDRFGHAVGDQVLQAVAHVLEGEERIHTVARWGGEEFLLLLPGRTLTQVEAVAHELVLKARHLHLSGITGVPISIGVAMRSEHSNPDHLLALADRRMYAAKLQGGDQWRSSSSDSS